MKSALLSLLLACACGAAVAGPDSDAYFKRATANVFEDDTPWAEKEQALPPYPSAPQWLDFTSGNTERNRLSIDAASLAIGDDGVVRYTLRVLSPGGVANISREGLQCRERTLRSYAFGDTYANRWIESMKPTWRPLSGDDTVRQALRRLVCDGGAPLASVEATLAAIRKNG